jgi:hypothetical protein
MPPWLCARHGTKSDGLGIVIVLRILVLHILSDEGFLNLQLGPA